MTEASSPASRRIRLARQATLTLLFALIGVLIVETLWLTQLPPIALLLILLLKTLPLILFIQPLRQRRPLAPVWFSALLLLYFCWAVLASWAPGTEGIFALIRALLVSACISAAMVWSWKGKQVEA